MKVICINDKNLPEGAYVEEGQEYEVYDSFQNQLEQNPYMLMGMNNQGTTKFGLKWLRYNANRFKAANSMMDRIFEKVAENQIKTIKNRRKQHLLQTQNL